MDLVPDDELVDWKRSLSRPVYDDEWAFVFGVTPDLPLSFLQRSAADVEMDSEYDQSEGEMDLEDDQSEGEMDLEDDQSEGGMDLEDEFSHNSRSESDVLASNASQQSSHSPNSGISGDCESSSDHLGEDGSGEACSIADKAEAFSQIESGRQVQGVEGDSIGLGPRRTVN